VWSQAPGIGWQRLQILINRFGNLADAWAEPEAVEQVLRRQGRMGSRAIDAWRRYRAELGAQPLQDPIGASDRHRWRRSGLLVHRDAALPTSLQELERPPLQLYWRGQGHLWPLLRRRQAVAVVGTRRPSRHGEAMAYAIGQALASAGWPVVSGLAEGIDAAAHRGCLEAGGRPVGILGTPLERVYPRHHADLQGRVGREGLLISESGPGTVVGAGHFAARNRLQVALACAVVLVECPPVSGALHSAELAWQQEVPLWVVPGDAARVSAAGSNRWLGQGASALLDPTDLMRQLGQGPLRTRRTTAAEPELASLLLREAALLAALGTGCSLEQLCLRLRQDPQQVGARLLQLELAGQVQAEAGLWWRPCRS
jgi:DNA processing protein